jgi:hypothetical protein
MFIAFAICMLLIAFAGFQHGKHGLEYMKPYEILEMVRAMDKKKWSVYVSGYIMALWTLAVVFGFMALTQGMFAVRKW